MGPSLDEILSKLNWERLYDVEVWLGAIFAVLVFVVPLSSAARSFIRQMRSAHYSELDRIYMEILKLALENPFLRDKDLIPHYVRYLRSQDPWLKARGLADEVPDWSADAAAMRREQALKYDSYAFIVFNFLETIRDRCDENRDWRGRPDKKLRGTWECILSDEYNLHRAWFEMETIPCADNRSTKFCTEFAQFMWDKRWNDERWVYFSLSNIRKMHPDKFSEAESAIAATREPLNT